MKTKSKKSKVGEVIAIGAGLAALAAAGYFFLGPKGKQNRKVARGWMIKMKGEVIEKMEGLKNITEEEYHKIVDAVAKAYASSGGEKEVTSLAKELKSHWNSISKKKTSKAKK